MACAGIPPGAAAVGHALPCSHGIVPTPPTSSPHSLRGERLARNPATCPHAITLAPGLQGSGLRRARPVPRPLDAPHRYPRRFRRLPSRPLRRCRRRVCVSLGHRMHPRPSSQQARPLVAPVSRAMPGCFCPLGPVSPSSGPFKHAYDGLG